MCRGEGEGSVAWMWKQSTQIGYERREKSERSVGRGEFIGVKLAFCSFLSRLASAFVSWSSWRSKKAAPPTELINYLFCVCFASSALAYACMKLLLLWILSRLPSSMNILRSNLHRQTRNKLMIKMIFARAAAKPTPHYIKNTLSIMKIGSN